MSRMSSARRRLLRGKASKYIGHAETVLQPGDKVVLCCRVSGWVQAKNENLDSQEATLQRFAQSHGVLVIAVFEEIGSGWKIAWLQRAATFAADQGAVLLATETDRFIRHPNYHSKLRPLLQARDVDLQNLKGETTGVTLLTLLHPDATPHDARSAQIKRGQQEKGCKGGRPPKRELGYKKQRRRKQLLRVLQLHDAGESHRKIAIVTGVPSSTVWRWIDGWT